MAAPKKLPTAPFEPGDGDRNVRDLRAMSKSGGWSPKGPLPDEETEDVVAELEALMDFGTRDVPEET